MGEMVDQADSTNEGRKLDVPRECADRRPDEARMNVVAVVVTYNRLRLLKEALHAVRAQTAPIGKIVVVDNDSTDGTREWLSSQAGLEVIRQANLGGAGGFETGMKRAFDSGADWIWVMDDDVAARPDALEIMLRYAPFSQCIMPSRFYSDGVPCKWGYVYDLKRRGIVFGTRAGDQDESKEYTTVNTCCFEGMLVARDIVSRIGFPDKRFFIAGDDTVYGLQASRHTNVIVVRDAVLIRAKTSADSRKVSPMFAYYYFRNFHLMEKYYGQLSGGKRYGLTCRMRYLREIPLYLLRSLRYNKRNFWDVARAIGAGVIDSMRRLEGRSFR